jgi:hypothetical protein
LIYLTFNDTYSGIYQGQVIDVIDYLNYEFNLDIQLIAFVPRSMLDDEKAKILEKCPNAMVFPISFGLSRWKWMRFKLKKTANKNQSCIARGPMACELALNHFDKVVYDGRAAVKSEIEEYDVTGGNLKINADLIQAEQNAVLHSDFRIAVSNRLVQFWKDEFGYAASNHVVIPCTISNADRLVVKEDSNPVTIIYSGGTGPWQSFDLVVDLLSKYLKKQVEHKVVFMTKENPSISKLMELFPGRVERKWLNHEDVFKVLTECDYGILIRDQKMTNQVASPVKFAEYLNAGLKVLISEKIGDYSELAKTENLGIAIDNLSIPRLDKVSNTEKERISRFAKDHFLKSSELIKGRYQKLINELT